MIKVKVTIATNIFNISIFFILRMATLLYLLFLKNFKFFLLNCFFLSILSNWRSYEMIKPNPCEIEGQNRWILAELRTRIFLVRSDISKGRIRVFFAVIRKGQIHIQTLSVSSNIFPRVGSDLSF